MTDSVPATDRFHLNRFVEAQAPVIDTVLAELRAGRKRTHWMWFVFPQLKGLGSSPQAQFYGIASRAEAQAYLQHPVLGPRLLEGTRLVLAVQHASPQEIFGSIDSIKFRSSMTLFSQADPTEPLFLEALQKYFRGDPDPLTVALLRRALPS